MPSRSVNKSGQRFILPLVGVAVFYIVSFVSAVVFLALNNWFGAGDIAGLPIQSLPLAFFLFVTSYLFISRTETWKVLYKMLLGIIMGVVFAYAWTFCFALVLGGWFYAISYPIFICWMLGSLACFLTILSVQNSKLILASLAIFGLGIFALSRAYIAASAPEPGLLVLFHEGTSNDQVNEFWSDYICIPTGRGQECALLEEISGAGAQSRGDHRGVLITFWKNVATGEIERIRGNMLLSPLVYSIEDYP